MKIEIKSLFIILVVMFFLPVIAFLFLFISFQSVSFWEPSPDVPFIQYGEFPFVVEYNLNGETYVVENSVICNYEGVQISGSLGEYKNRQWTASVNGIETAFIELGTIEENAELALRIGTAEYYMSDPDSHGVPPGEILIRNRINMTLEEALAKVEIITMDFSPPIENDYSPGFNIQGMVKIICIVLNISLLVSFFRLKPILNLQHIKILKICCNVLTTVNLLFFFTGVFSIPVVYWPLNYYLNRVKDKLIYTRE